MHMWVYRHGVIVASKKMSSFEEDELKGWETYGKINEFI